MSENIKNTAAESAQNAAGAAEAVTHDMTNPYRLTQAFIRTRSRSLSSTQAKPIRP